MADLKSVSWVLKNENVQTLLSQSHENTFDEIMQNVALRVAAITCGGEAGVVLVTSLHQVDGIFIDRY